MKRKHLVLCLAGAAIVVCIGLFFALRPSQQLFTTDNVIDISAEFEVVPLEPQLFTRHSVPHQHGIGAMQYFGGKVYYAALYDTPAMAQGPLGFDIVSYDLATQKQEILCTTPEQAAQIGGLAVFENSLFWLYQTRENKSIIYKIDLNTHENEVFTEIDTEKEGAQISKISSYKNYLFWEVFYDEEKVELVIYDTDTGKSRTVETSASPLTQPYNLEATADAVFHTEQAEGGAKIIGRKQNGKEFFALNVNTGLYFMTASDRFIQWDTPFGEQAYLFDRQNEQTYKVFQQGKKGDEPNIFLRRMIGDTPVFVLHKDGNDNTTLNDIYFVKFDERKMYTPFASAEQMAEGVGVPQLSADGVCYIPCDDSILLIDKSFIGG